MSIALALAMAASVVSLLALSIALASAARLRQAVEQGSLHLGPDGLPRPKLPEIDSVVGDFTAEAVDGKTYSREDIETEEHLIAFFAAGCRPCEDDLPNFLTAAQKRPPGVAKPMAVVVGEDEKAEKYLSAFSDEFTVFREPEMAPSGALSIAVGVKAYPTYVVVRKGRIELASNSSDGVIA